MDVYSTEVVRCSRCHRCRYKFHNGEWSSWQKILPTCVRANSEVLLVLCSDNCSEEEAGKMARPDQGTRNSVADRFAEKLIQGIKERRWSNI